MHPLRRDVIAGLTVAAVLVPQSLAYADVAGMPAASGLYASALPPLAAALFASSPYLQTGPVAITSLLTFGALSAMAPPGSDEYVGLGIILALLVGLVRVIIGFSRLGVIAHLMSEPMLRGFLPAAAILIAATQIPALVGLSNEGGVLESALTALVSPNEWSIAALGFSAGTAAVILATRRISLLFPGVLLALVVAIGCSSALAYGGSIVGEIPVGLPDLPTLRLSSTIELLLPATVIAVVGFAEAATVAKAFAAQDRRAWEPDREFIGQGAANLASAISGGFPVGGSLSRSALNRMAGARTRASGAFTGLTVLLVLPFVAILAPLPTAVLAAIVILAVTELIGRLRLLRRLWNVSRPQSMIALTTFVLTLAMAPRVDLAVLTGIAMSIAWHLIRELRVDLHESLEGTTLVVRPTGVLWFATAESMQQRVIDLLEQHPSIEVLRLHLDGLGRIDVTGALVLRDLRENTCAAGIDVEVRGVPAQASRLFRRVDMDIDEVSYDSSSEASG